MIRHVSCLTLRPDTTDEQRAAVLDALAQMPKLIPEVRSYSFGFDLGLGEGNATLAVIAEFYDEAGYLAYRDHPDHLGIVGSMIKPLLTGRAALQYAVEG